MTRQRILQGVNGHPSCLQMEQGPLRFLFLVLLSLYSTSISNYISQTYHPCLSYESRKPR
uniref:Uncharacterized protein n=1 Tax=Octopus bimaculoides TaxID=37653 RepID=A0A0L8GQB6_OCTBM